MAKLGVRIEATEEGTSKQGGFENLPNGVYSLQLEAASVDEKDEGTREHKITVKTTIEVLEPAEYSGRKFFANYNIQHPNPDAQRIGNEQFQCLLRALELTEVPDDETDNLLFKSFTATVGMGKDSKEKNEDGTPKWPARNEVKRYWFPDQANAPEIGITGPVPVRTAPTNDNRRPAANDNRAAEPAKAAGARPWGKKA